MNELTLYSIIYYWRGRHQEGEKNFLGSTRFLFALYYLSLVHNKFSGTIADFCLFLCLFKTIPSFLFYHCNIKQI